MIRAIEKRHQGYRPFPLAALLLAAAQVAVAGNALVPTTAAPEKVVQVRQRDSIIQELDLGPDGTELWRKIQYLIANLDDLNDFSKLVALFNFTITDPVDAVSLQKPDLQRRYDIKSERYGYMLQSIDYGISKISSESHSRTIRLTFDFDLSAICISHSEVRRVYGQGSIAIPTHAPPRFYNNPAELAGLMFYENYGMLSPNTKRSPIEFSYMNSGCLRRVEFVSTVSE